MSSSTGRSNQTGKSRLRSSLAFAITGVVAIAVGLMTGVGTSFAHHPLISASVSCDGTVSWTATAWQPTDGNVSERENPDIRVSYLEWGVGPKFPVGSGSFEAGNNYTFSGSFQFPSTPGVLRILVWVDAVGAWGNGVPGGSAWSDWVDKPTPCGDTTTTTTVSDTSGSTSSSSTSTTVSDTSGSSSSTSSTTTTVADTSGSSSTTSTVSDTSGSSSTSTTLVDAESSTTQVGGDGGTTTTVSGTLPSTGAHTGSLALIASGITCLGISTVLMARRRRTA